MKKLVILVVTLLSSSTFALDKASETIAYTLANVVYTVALGIASIEGTALSTSSQNPKEQALRIQNEAQAYYQSGIASVFLESQIQMAKDLDANLSKDESVDLLVEASQIILNR